MYQLTAIYEPPADPAAFDKYYNEVHLDLGAKLPGLQRLTLCWPGPDPDGNPPRYHLVVTLEWADKASFQQALSGPEGQAALADLPNFAEAGVTFLDGDGRQIR